MDHIQDSRTIYTTIFAATSGRHCIVECPATLLRSAVDVAADTAHQMHYQMSAGVREEATRRDTHE